MEDQYLIDKNRYNEDVKNGIIPEKTLIEKQVWESTLNRSMVLEAENTKLKELLKEAYPVIEFGDGTMMSKWEENWLTKAKEILGEDK